jgi:hypothetical protein
VQSGPEIGRVIVLHRPVMRLKRAGPDEVIVTRKGNHDHLTYLGSRATIKVNGTLKANDSFALVHNTTIEIAGVRFCFFAADGLDPQAAAVD